MCYTVTLIRPIRENRAQFGKIEHASQNQQKTQARLSYSELKRMASCYLQRMVKQKLGL